MSKLPALPWTSLAVRVALGTATLAALPAAVQAETREVPSRNAQAGALLALLRAPHPQVDAPLLHRIGPDVNALLVEHALSRQAEPQVRLRAMAWLQHFATPASRAVLRETLNDPKAPVAVQRVALRAYALAFRVEALPLVKDRLQSREMHVREAAAYALGDIDDRRVRAILVDHMEREPELTVRDALMTALARVDERERQPRR